MPPSETTGAFASRTPSSPRSMSSASICFSSYRSLARGFPVSGGCVNHDHCHHDAATAGVLPAETDAGFRVLAIDVGAGTQDILIYESDKTPENCFKLVLPS